MTYTLEELKQALIDRLDEITLVEILELSPEDIVEAFSEQIEDRFDYFKKVVDEMEI